MDVCSDQHTRPGAAVDAGPEPACALVNSRGSAGRAITLLMGVKKVSSFNAQAFLDSAGVARTIKEYRRAEVIFSQGDVCESVMYLQKGGVKLSVLSKPGREAVVAMLGPGDFFGEGCLAGQPVRIGTATAIARARSSSSTRTR